MPPKGGAKKKAAGAKDAAAGSSKLAPDEAKLQKRLAEIELKGEPAAWAWWKRGGSLAVLRAPAACCVDAQPFMRSWVRSFAFARSPPAPSSHPAYAACSPRPPPPPPLAFLS